MIDIDEIRSRGKVARDGFYHVVGVHYVVREADFDALISEVEILRQEARIRNNINDGLSAELRELRAEVERLREQRHDDGKGRRVDAYLAGALDERAAVVAWLRYEAEMATGTNTTAAFQHAARLDTLADDIERGEHRREEEP